MFVGYLLDFSQKGSHELAFVSEPVALSSIFLIGLFLVAHRLFLKFYIKLEGLKGQKLTAEFSEKLGFFPKYNLLAF